MRQHILRSLAGLTLAVGVSTAWADGDPSIACFGALASNPALAPIQGKVVMKIGAHPDLAMLSDEHRPTKGEKGALSVWVKEGEKCFDLGHDFRSANYAPVVSALIDESMHALEALVAKLYSGKLTYAQFNEQRQASDDEYRERIARANQTLQAERTRDQANEQAQQASIETQRRTAAAQEAAVEAQREATEEAAQRERRALALQLLSNMKPAYVPPPPVIQPPRIQNTNCSAFGNQLNCTTTGY
ncbi:hypothetical protein [Burkholderia sp. Bp9143]|uniref:hypothetical protein n=1 Tax=Burkholderia sp. Bp9143 TaxID=2184574 RepID=UPI000F5AF03A|nr:hypothetical protein [Burkholderia sp. Bp9143]